MFTTQPMWLGCIKAIRIHFNNHALEYDFLTILTKKQNINTKSKITQKPFFQNLGADFPQKGKRPKKVDSGAGEKFTGGHGDGWNLYGGSGDKKDELAAPMWQALTDGKGNECKWGGRDGGVSPWSHFGSLLPRQLAFVSAPPRHRCCCRYSSCRVPRFQISLLPFSRPIAAQRGATGSFRSLFGHVESACSLARSFSLSLAVFTFCIAARFATRPESPVASRRRTFSVPWAWWCMKADTGVVT